MEHQRGLAYSPEQLDAFTARFFNRTDVYPIQKADGSYGAVRQSITHAILLAHLQGLHTIGTYALDPTNAAKWLCLDADAPMQWEQLKQLANDLQQRHIPAYREQSRRGGHLWFFFPSPLPGLHVRRFALQLLTEQGIYPAPPGDKPIELYPRQVQLVENGLGSLVRLPLGIHRKSGKVYPFVDQNQLPLAPTPKELLPILAEVKPIALPFILSLVARAPQTELPSPTPAFQVKRVRHLQDRPPSERILTAISTLDFVRQYVQLDSQNRGHCPFHDDEHQSFNVVESGNYWNCFAGCGGGNLIHFWSKWRAEHGEDGSFVETVRDLLKLLEL